MTDLEAIAIIARHAIDPGIQEFRWEDYPDIGEGDWERIVYEADHLVPRPTEAEYREAYALLSARAKVEEAK